MALRAIKLYDGNCPFFMDLGDTDEAAVPTAHLNLCERRAEGL